ncbi:MAG: hypothetical protein JO359_05255 [Candidatus Eremiobacteraeota bacterium]|nr:hypothetical protein [Candidatus Eremiobacteraeota bacterium]
MPGAWHGIEQVLRTLGRFRRKPTADASAASSDGAEGHEDESGGIAFGDLAIWILIPAAGYFGGVLYQAGFAYYYGLPVEVLNTESIAVFEAFQSYVDILFNHFTWTFVVILGFLIYLAILPKSFYQRWGAPILTLAVGAFLVSFSVRPITWALAGFIVVIALQLFAARFPTAHVSTVNPFAAKMAAIFIFLFASLFAVGYGSAYYQKQYYITDGKTHFVVLAFQGTDMVVVPLVDASCKNAKDLPETLQGYYFGDDVKIYSLGDADTPEFHLYDTDGLRDAGTCGSGPAPPQGWKDFFFI